MISMFCNNGTIPNRVTVYELTSSSTVWLPKANVHARACYFIASIAYTEKLWRLHLQRRKASIRSAPWNMRASGCASDALLKASPAKCLSVCTEQHRILLYLLCTWVQICYRELLGTQIHKYLINILPVLEHVTVRFVVVDDSSFPSRSTHQHSPVALWHCTTSKLPSNLHRGTNLSGSGGRLIASCNCFWHWVSEISEKKKTAIYIKEPSSWPATNSTAYDIDYVHYSLKLILRKQIFY